MSGTGGVRVGGDVNTSQFFVLQLCTVGTKLFGKMILSGERNYKRMIAIHFKEIQKNIEDTYSFEVCC